MRRSGGKRHWFHCADEYHGEAWIARKRVPKCMPETEPLVPRLCVCDTIAACFAARMPERGKPVHVYRTITPRKSVKPYDVWDQIITGERWLVPPVKMAHVQRIGTGTIEEIAKLFRLYHGTGRKSDVRLRVAQYALAIRVLGPSCTSRFEARLVDMWAQRFRIVDPEQYVVSRIIAAATEESEQNGPCTTATTDRPGD